VTERAEAQAQREPGVYRCRVVLGCNFCSCALMGYAAEGPTPADALTEAVTLVRTEARQAGWRLAAYANQDRCPTCAKRRPP
jgi:hypothetical protein